MAPTGAGTPAGPGDTAALTALGSRLIDLLNAGDEVGLAGIACGEFSGDVAAEGTIDPQTDPIVFSRVEDLLVTGDTASGRIFAGEAGSEPTGADATFGRTAGTWQICSLG
ncbi:hypothetical protein GCM10027047_09590 [Rhodococcus aerolatus]